MRSGPPARPGAGPGTELARQGGQLDAANEPGARPEPTRLPPSIGPGSHAADVPAGGATAAGSDSDRRDPGEPKIFVRPRPGAMNVPSEITPESLAGIELQRDAAPAGSEAEAEQSASRMFRDERYADARAAALEALDQFPENRAMRRLVVASSCIMNDADTAREHFARLGGADRRLAMSRCQKYGIALAESRLR